MAVGAKKQFTRRMIMHPNAPLEPIEIKSKLRLRILLD
jgi:hypothetical protein